MPESGSCHVIEIDPTDVTSWNGDGLLEEKAGESVSTTTSAVAEAVLPHSSVAVTVQVYVPSGTNTPESFLPSQTTETTLFVWVQVPAKARTAVPKEFLMVMAHVMGGEASLTLALKPVVSWVPSPLGLNAEGFALRLEITGGSCSPMSRRKDPGPPSPCTMLEAHESKATYRPVLDTVAFSLPGQSDGLSWLFHPMETLAV